MHAEKQSLTSSSKNFKESEQWLGGGGGGGGEWIGLNALTYSTLHTCVGDIATCRSTAETSTSAFSKALASVHFSAINREQCTKSPIGTPTMSRLGRWESFTKGGKMSYHFF